MHLLAIERQQVHIVHRHGEPIFRKDELGSLRDSPPNALDHLDDGGVHEVATVMVTRTREVLYSPTKHHRDFSHLLQVKSLHNVTY
jgi:hypothetical protein